MEGEKTRKTKGKSKITRKNCQAVESVVQFYEFKGKIESAGMMESVEIRSLGAVTAVKDSKIAPIVLDKTDFIRFIYRGISEKLHLGFLTV